eukprot:scaffold5002_cov64-Phaeocystis_antarctica.AAC.4
METGSQVKWHVQGSSVGRVAWAAAGVVEAQEGAQRGARQGRRTDRARIPQCWFAVVAGCQ